MAYSPASDARQFAVEQANNHLKHLTLQMNRAIKSCSAGAVHDVRVAIRRFSQAVAVCRSYFDAADLPKNRRIKKVMNGAGEVRNCDIALKFVAKFREPHAIHLRAKLQGRRKESATLLVADLRKWKDRRMPVKWRAALNSPPAKEVNEPVRELAQRALSRTAKEFLKRGNEATSADASPKLLHRFRIEAKKFRYALELFEPLYRSTLEPIVESIKRLSTLLGDINDCVTVSEMVAEYKGGKSVADRLKKRQHKKAEEFREYWKEFSASDRLSGLDKLRQTDPQAVRKPAASSSSNRQKTTAA
jgi:CHAD domain-containing protein